MKTNSILPAAGRFFIAAFIFATSAIAAAEPDYSSWNAILKKYVNHGKKAGIVTNLVKYRQLATDPAWASATKSIMDFDTTQLRTRNEKLAFFINAYNMAAIRKVLGQYPTGSIRTKGDGVWKENAIRLAGKDYSLDAIENNILRPMGDARIHFAIVCASLSCPDLRREAYTAARIQTQLESQTESFLKNTTKGCRVENGRIFQSAIFSWFQGDFQDTASFQRKFIKSLPASGQRIEMPYNWSLNE